MLPHVAIRSVGLIYRLHFPLGTFTPCTAPTGTLPITTDVTKSLRSHYSLRIAITIMSTRTASFAAVYTFIPQNARCIAMFR